MRCSPTLVLVCSLSLAACSNDVADPVGGGPPSGAPTGYDPSLPRSNTSAAPAVCSQAAFTGAPLDTPDGKWTWVPFPEARCRDGSTTGIGLRRHAGSNKLAIYLEGGGACFHPASCDINAFFASFNESSFNGWTALTGSAGIFDDSRSDNPFHDWNMVYVPYCTGDVHAGSAEHVDVPGDAPKDQLFVGYRNIGHYLERLVPTFAEAEQVVVTGISAGGFGAALNYHRMAQAFCHSQVTLIDDSGPPMSDEFLAPCLQKRWRDLWKLDLALPRDCPECSQPDGGGIVNYVPYLARKYPSQRLSLISANQDGIISLFFGYGANDCAGLIGDSAGMSGETFEAGIDDLRDKYLDASHNFGSYVIPSTSHTWLNALAFYGTTVHGVALPAWVDLLVNQDTVTHVAP